MPIYDPFDKISDPFEVVQKEAIKPSKVTGGSVAIDDNKNGNGFDTAVKTLESVGRVYPVLENAANLVTSTYGVPVSGLAGLLSLPLGLDKAGKAIEKTQEALVYKPKTEHGEYLQKQISYPFEKLDVAGEYAAKPFEESGYPNVAASIRSGVNALPVAISGKSIFKGSTPAETALNLSIKKNIDKSIRPTVVGKQTRTQITKYYDNAITAVKEIASNKENLQLVDKDGFRKTGLPETLDEFSQAIDQTKKNIFKEYDNMTKEADDAGGISIDLKKTAGELKSVLNNKTLKDLSPETIQYAKYRMSKLQGRGKYTAAETQDAIQFLNQTLEKFYRDPSPALKGQALVDSLIANDLRKQLDTAIENSTGMQYQPLKRKYGALKTIEKEVNHRAVVDARRNVKGLLDFSDIATGSGVVKAMLTKDPVSFAVSATGKGISHYYKMLNDPNRIVKTMFKDIDKYIGGDVPSNKVGLSTLIGSELYNQTQGEQ